MGMPSYGAIGMRGVVYDVGVYFNGDNLSLVDFDTARVAYDMDIIKNILRCNTVRIEGESIDRLAAASRIAARNGLKVLFNPWKMEADERQTIKYMSEAAEAAEKLRNEGIETIFVAGCEYSLFNKGVFPGETLNDRMKWLFSVGSDPAAALPKIEEANRRLNSTLSNICKAIRDKYKGKVSYSSGTWESVDWDLFDVVGVDYYRRGESDEDYISGLERFRVAGKPTVVMEFGCCAYKGAAPRGGEAFSIYQGVDENGNAVYEGGVTPERSEAEQADYIEGVLTLLDKAGVDGACVYAYSFPLYPYDKDGIDMDMISYAIVKSYPEGDPHRLSIPSWTPKEAFFRLGKIYTEMEEKEDRNSGK